MAQMTFGAVLREARERKGLDLATAARRLRIRADILRAIENDDFSRMPPRGYTRNMVNAYARLVGLNPSEITRMYLDEAYAYQVGRTRSESAPQRSSRPGAARDVRTSRGEERTGRDRDRASGRGAAPHTGRDEGARTQRSSLRRDMYDDRRDFAPRGAASERARGRGEDHTRRSRHSALPTTQYTNFYAGPKAPGAIRSRLPIVIAAAVILVLLIVVLALALGGRGSSSESERPKVAITGVTDTSAQGTSEGTSDEAQQTQAQTATETAPTSVEVTYKAASGTEAYVVITQDGVATEQMVSGAVDETVEVTGTWSLATWVSSAFTVTVDGSPVDFAADASGMPTVTVSFEDYLDAWYDEHPNVTRPDSSADATTSTTTSTTSTGTTGTSTSTSGTTS